MHARNENHVMFDASTLALNNTALVFLEGCFTLQELVGRTALCVEWLIPKLLILHTYIYIYFFSLQAKHNPEASIQSLCHRMQLGPLICV